MTGLAWPAGEYVISRVGPKGYVHGWIFVGVPVEGDDVFHPHHGHGTVTGTDGGNVKVRFHQSGAEHSFPVRPGAGTPRFDRLTDEQVVAQLGNGQGERFQRALAELDRRDAAERDQKVRALYQQAPATRGDADHVYQSLVSLGENPEDAWAHAYNTNTDAMRRSATVAQLRAQGYAGSNFDAITRAAFRDEVQRQAIAAESATNGFMLNDAGRTAGVDPWSLMTGPEVRARKYASDELKGWWDTNGRPTVAGFQDQLLGHAGAAGPRGGDFLK